MEQIKSSAWWIVIAVVSLALLVGCASAAAKDKNKVKYLKLFAFNYTERYLIHITVDGVWMGGADAYTNGGSAMGPRPPRNRNKQHSIEVHWQLSGLYDMKTDTYSRAPLENRSATVPIKFPYPENPNELILHFYPDGHVEAEMIDQKENVFDFRRIPIPEGHREHGRR